MIFPTMLVRQILTIALLFIFQAVMAFDKTPITRIGIQQGLSNNSIRAVYQDHKGLMWFGTYDGLNLFDGYSFKVFRNKLNDSTSIPHNYIYSLYEDRQKDLWVGTGQGIAIYNSIYSRFHPAYYFPVNSKVKSRISFNVTSIRSTARGTVLIGTNGFGLLTQRSGEDAARQLIIAGNRVNYNVQAMAEDKKGNVWLFLHDIGLCVYDEANQVIRVVNGQLRSATTLAADGDNEIWIGTMNGLYRYAIGANQMIAYYAERPGQLTASGIACLYQDRQNNFWIGTEGGGVNILKPDGKFEYLLPGEGNDALSSESVYAIGGDNESRIWLGTLKGGINIIDPQKGRFQTIVHKINDRNSLVNNFVSAFCELSKDELIVGTDGGGLSVWNRTRQSFTNYEHSSADPGSLSNNSVSSILKDHKGRIWVATFGGGVNLLQGNSGRFEHFSCINDSLATENRNAWLVYEDRELNIWVTTFGVGKLYRFNAALNRFEVFDQRLNDLISIAEDHNGHLWAGNSHQLIRIDRNQHNHLMFEIGKPVRAIFEDSQNKLWLGTEGGGLILFDQTDGKVAARYSDADGLSNNGVLNILQDQKGFLWLSTFNGLSRYDPVRHVFKNFFQSDGLQSNQFSYNAALHLRSGEMLFGGISGFNIFDPAGVASRSYMPPVLFTNVFINNRSSSEAAKYINEGKGGDRITEIRVPFSEAVLSFEFTAVEYSSPEKIRYAYYLEGWDKSWNYTGKARTVNYNNVREGRYILRVKSTNAEGIWNTEEATIRIRVFPPWYRTTLAYILYISFASGLVYLYFRYRAYQASLRYEIKLAHVNAEKEKEINEKRQSFFTNIAHEFRTPLTLIINPIKDFLKSDSSPDDESGKQFNVVYRNARRLLTLVDQLLLFTKAEKEGDQLRVTRLNLYDLCKEVWLCFAQQAKSRNIEYRFEAENHDMELYGDRDKIEIIFYNLLSNAIKYTPPGGTVTFSIKETNNTFLISVTDSGYGIPAHVADRLFEKFYQVKDKNVPSKHGFGIGLYLVKHFVDSHKGQVTYQSEPGKGTSFFVTLLKGYADFELEEPYAEAEDAGILEELSSEVEAEAATPVKEPGDGLEAIVNDSRSMLVVDDDDQMRAYIADIFRSGFQIYDASDAEKALKLARQYQPDIIISDVVMEGISGIELCKIIKSTPALSHIPFILLTGSFSPESKLQGVEGGADDYITKPFEKELLQARVTSLLKNRQNLQQYFYNEITHQENSLKVSSEYKEFLDTCIAIVEKHLDNDDFNIQTLAREIGMSHSRLYKKIKAVSGHSANAFIRFIRLRKAAELFINSSYNISQVAFYVGIRDVKYFREQFSKTFGMKPSEYIEKYRKGFGKNFNLNEKIVKPRN